MIAANSGEVGYCLTASAQNSLDAETETLIAVAHALRGEGHDASEDGTGRGTPIIAIQERAVSENPDAGPGGAGYSTEGAAYTLEARHHVQAVAFRTAGDGAVYEEGDVTAPLTTATDPNAQVVAFSVKDHGGDAMEGCSPTLRAGTHDGSHQNGGVMPAVAFDMRGREGGAMPEGPHDTANIRAADGGSSRSYVAQPWAVRRLTPRECERLQGFPDGFTAIPWRGKPAELCPDGPRYKALGNSWAVNVAEWVGGRIAEVDGWEAAA